jgi:hypothetical protein
MKEKMDRVAAIKAELAGIGKAKYHSMNQPADGF